MTHGGFDFDPRCPGNFSGGRTREPRGIQCAKLEVEKNDRKMDDMKMLGNGFFPIFLSSIFLLWSLCRETNRRKWRAGRIIDGNKMICSIFLPSIFLPEFFTSIRPRPARRLVRRLSRPPQIQGRVHQSVGGGRQNSARTSNGFVLRGNVMVSRFASKSL